MQATLCTLTIFAFSSVANADVNITYGTVEGGTNYIDLQPEMANQVVLIFGTGIVADGGADGMELDVQIGDGGADLGGVDTSPIITSIDMITGTIWQGSTPTQTDSVSFPLGAQSTVDTTSLANADGLLAAITFDTTGFGVGEIDFQLTGVAGSFDTFLSQGASPLTTNAPNGIIRVTAIPEPASASIVVLGMIGLCARRRRN